MRRIIVMNSKGGCGKTTVATNLASRYANRGYATALFDYDPQASSMRWLTLRDPRQPGIHGVAAVEDSARSVTRAWQLRIPPTTQRIVIDTPAGLHLQERLPQLRDADTVLVPVLPSSLDIHATTNFIRDLLLIAKLRSHGTRLAIIANRLRRNTRSLAALERFLTTLDIPVIARIQDIQRYVQAAEAGMGVHELNGRGAYADRLTWDQTVDWLEHAGTSRLGQAFSARLRAHHPTGSRR